MPDLVTQKSWIPTRKMMAVIITGAIMGAMRAAAGIFFPDSPVMALVDSLDNSVLAWVDYALTALPMIVAGWLTKERA